MTNGAVLQASMITGYDKRGANLYYVDSDGLRLKHNYFSVGELTYSVTSLFCVMLTHEAYEQRGCAVTVRCFVSIPGSGSSYAYGVLDSGYKFEMSFTEACELAKRAIYAATLRDVGTGGEVMRKYWCA